MSSSSKSRYAEADLNQVTRYPMSELERKVKRGAFAHPTRASATFREFADSLPKILAAEKLHEFARYVSVAARNRKQVIVMFGGHVIKTGLAPLLIDWMERGIISALATNGAGAIHDTEIALFGRTSEDVADELADGRFGMSQDTADFINQAISDPGAEKLGYGEALGCHLENATPDCADLSLLCNAYRLGIPLTVHVALGTDIIHQHPGADGAAIGRNSLRDFRIFAHQVGKLDHQGVVINIGSAVIMPEVFLKALSVARNLGAEAHGFTAANFDMLSHYRPNQNVLNRPTLTGGRKFHFTGHHEIQIPLLHAMVNEKLHDD